MDAAGSTLEARRLAVIQRYQILDTPPDGAFDRVTAIAARLFQVPIALVTIVDHNRIWFKSRYGLEIPQIEREPGLCASAILRNDIYTITDALTDPRTLTNSLVRGEFGLRFYAAAPLTTQDGYNLGTLCVIDHQPRSITPNEIQTLKDLAAIIMDEMELRLSARQLMATTQAQRDSIEDLYHHAPCGYHSLDAQGVFVDINDTELDWLGYQRHQVVGQLRFSDLLTPASQAVFATNFPQFKRQGQVQDLEFELVRADGSGLYVLLNAKAEYDAQGNYLKSRSTVHNISDRKRAELALKHLNESLETTIAERTAQLTARNRDLAASHKALHESTLQFRNAFDYAGIGMALVSLEGHWLEVNRALCDITGYTEAELLAIDFQSMTHPDDLDTDLALVQQLIDQEIRHYHLEKRYRHKQGHWIWIMLSVSIVRDTQQAPLYFVAQVQDIHEHKQADLALEQSQARLLEAQAIGHIGSWEYDVHSQKITWSAEKFRILGRDPRMKEPTFADLLRLHHPDDGDQLRQAVDHTLATGEPYSLRLQCTRSDGSLGYIEDRGQAECNGEGQVVRLYGVTQDITERVQAEAELREMAAALANAVEGISRLDPAGHYISVNQAYATMVGYTPDELVGQNWQITVHPDDLPRLTQAYEDMLAQGKVHVQARGLRKDGSIFHKQLVMVTAYDDQQQFSGHFCFMQDISDRKQAELTLQQELQRLSKVVATQQIVAQANPDRDQVIALIIQQTRHLVGAAGAAVELLEDDELVCHAASGLLQSHDGWRLSLEGSLSGQCLAERTLLYCQDLDCSDCSYFPLFQQLGLRSMAVVPLTYQAKPVGVLKVLSTEPSAFTEADQHTLQLLAGLLAASLHLAAEFEAKTTLLQALQDSEDRYRSVVAALSEGVAMVQADGTISACNASATEIVGLQVNQVIDRPVADLDLHIVHEDGSPCSFQEYPVIMTLRTGQPLDHQVLGLVKPSGTTWISSNTRPLFRDGEVRPYATVVSFTDITELRRSEVAALRRQAEQERILSDIAQRIRHTLHLEVILKTTVTEVQGFLATDRVMIYCFEPNGYGTVIAEATTPGQPSLLGQKIHTTLTQADLAFYQEGNVQACDDLSVTVARRCPIDQLIQTRAKVIVPIVQNSSLWGLLLAYHCQGPRPWETAELDVLSRLATQLAIAIQQSQLYQRLQGMNRQLEHLATHDGLTEVANRRSFDIHLNQEWSRLLREQAPLSLIMCDIDHFKPYNDTYGHPAGDVCLQKVAQAIAREAKRPADLVARYGGEEFAVVLSGTDQAGGEAIAQAIQQGIADLNLFHGASPIGQRITLSLGIASTIPSRDRTCQSLIDAADVALYEAKHQGRNRYCAATVGPAAIDPGVY